MKKERVILDTNLWISFLITKEYVELDNLILKNKIQLIFSDELIQEFISVAERPKFKKIFTQQDIKQLLGVFDVYGELVKVNSKINKCRDPKDDFLLNLALDSNADYLITGDADLLTLQRIGKTKIINWKGFLKIQNH